jgi:hypothetical protein
MKPTKTKPAYNSIAATDDVHWKLEQWRRYLSDQHGERWTFSMTIDYLLDNAGVPGGDGGDEDIPPAA